MNAAVSGMRPIHLTSGYSGRPMQNWKRKNLKFKNKTLVIQLTSKIGKIIYLKKLLKKFDIHFGIWVPNWVESLQLFLLDYELNTKSQIMSNNIK